MIGHFLLANQLSWGTFELGQMTKGLERSFSTSASRVMYNNIWVWVNTYRYMSSGMNIHLPAILGFTRYQGFDPSPYNNPSSVRQNFVRCSGLLVTLSVGLRHVRNLGGTMQVAGCCAAVELKNIGVKGQQHSTAMFLYLSLKGKTYIYIYICIYMFFKSWFKCSNHE